MLRNESHEQAGDGDRRPPTDHYGLERSYVEPQMTGKEPEPRRRGRAVRQRARSEVPFRGEPDGNGGRESTANPKIGISARGFGEVSGRELLDPAER